MTAGTSYENKAYDGDNPIKPPPNTEDTVSVREKVKLSRSEKWRILKNVAILSSAFMIQFTAFQVSEHQMTSIQLSEYLRICAISTELEI